jgi:hypothetical protein
MRRVSQRLALVSASIAAAIGSGCAPTLQVAFDAREDFSLYHTWDFGAAETTGAAAAPEHQAGLEAELVRAIARTLDQRGYRRAAERPDLQVSYQLSLERRKERVLVPRAPYLLSSNSHTGSYWIEGSDTEERSYDDLRLSIEVADRGGRGIWKGALRERIPQGRSTDLAAAVVSLFERFPRATPRPQRDRRDQLARLGI